MPKSHAITIEGLATDYPAGTVVAPHVHDTHQIVFANDGVSRVVCEGAQWVLPPGRGLWVPAQTEHTVHCVSSVRMRTVYIAGDRTDFPSDVRVVTVSDLMRETIIRFSKGAAPNLLPHLTAILIEEILRAEVPPLRLVTPADPRIARLFREFCERPADGTSLEEWSRRLAMSRRSLIRHIRAETGMSFRALRRQTRIVAAQERLALGKPVTAVAFDVGFESASAFIVAFKAITGVTPGQFARL